MHTHSNFAFKRVLNFSLFFNSSTKLFQAIIINAPLRTSLLLNVFPPIQHTTFKTNSLRLVTNERRLKRLLVLYKQIIQSYLSLHWL